MKKRLMILGASRYYVRSILAAQELGCEVVVTDKNPAAYGFQYADHYEVMDICDVEGSVRVAKEYGVDAVIAVNDFGVRSASVIAQELGLAGIGPQVAEYATSKAWMRKMWEEAGVPSAKFRMAKTLDQALRAAEALNVWPLILKPADSRGGGSRGVSRADDLDGFKRAFKFAQNFYNDKTVVIEEYLEGSEHSLETLTIDGTTHILAVSDKVKTPPPFRVDKSVIYPTSLIGKELESIHGVAKAAIRALGINIGAAHVEMCFTTEGPKLIEVGARCGGGGTPDPIVPFVSGIDMLKEVVRVALGEKPEDLFPRHNRGCVYRFLTPRPGVVRAVTGQEEVKKWSNILDCGVLVGKGDEVRPIKVGADRAGFVIAGGETRDEAIELADRADLFIRFSYENGN